MIITDVIVWWSRAVGTKLVLAGLSGSTLYTSNNHIYAYCLCVSNKLNSDSDSPDNITGCGVCVSLREALLERCDKRK